MSDTIPANIAIIPDGNRRWAQLKGVPKIEGHRAGADRMHEVVETLVQLGVRYLTVWGFSTDNWKRTDEEVDSIFLLLQMWIERDTPYFQEKDIRLRHIGRIEGLPTWLQEQITEAIDLTKHNRGLTLSLAFNYSGRAEIIDAVERMMHNSIRPELVNEELFSRYLYTEGMPDVDLVIRTADEFRLSNFMLWQTAYSEYYFTPALWPEFDKAELLKALAAYSERRRRFGGD